MANEEEAARTLICAERAPLGGYTLPTSARTISEIQFIEVRPDLRKQGVARAFLSTLSDLHPGWLVAPVLPGAEGFWDRSGWQRVQPDGNDRRSAAYVTFK